MNDYIKRSEVLDLFGNYCFADYRGNGKSSFTNIVMPSFYEKILNLSSADVVEVKHGEWKTDREEIVVRYGDEYEMHIPYCSECGWKRSNVYEYLGPGKVKWNFCPNCGADMRGETNG